MLLLTHLSKIIRNSSREDCAVQRIQMLSNLSIHKELKRKKSRWNIFKQMPLITQLVEIWAKVRTMYQLERHSLTSRTKQESMVDKICHQDRRAQEPHRVISILWQHQLVTRTKEAWFLITTTWQAVIQKLLLLVLVEWPCKSMLRLNREVVNRPKLMTQDRDSLRIHQEG